MVTATYFVRALAHHSLAEHNADKSAGTTLLMSALRLLADALDRVPRLTPRLPADLPGV